jgi:pyrroloquinoline quinone biosynthesis protein D
MPDEPTGKQVSPADRPYLPIHVVLKHDASRDRWVLLAPERVLSPDPVALDVLRLCNGRRSIAGIAEELAEQYDAPYGRILDDITTLLAKLIDQGVIAL